MANTLFEFTVRAVRAPSDEAGPSGNAALIPCYSSGEDYQEAIRKAVRRLSEMGFVFDSLRGKVREIDVALWPEYVKKVWPEFPDSFPPPEMVPAIIGAGGVFFGPFSGFTE